MRRTNNIDGRADARRRLELGLVTLAACSTTFGTFILHRASVTEGSSVPFAWLFREDLSPPDFFHEAVKIALSCFALTALLELARRRVMRRGIRPRAGTAEPN